ncbi:MAG: LamG-like jellyroll fold domain-containing protein [Planctomycetota bacterium]
MRKMDIKAFLMAAIAAAFACLEASGEEPVAAHPTEGYLPQFTRTVKPAKCSKVRIIADYPEELGLGEWPVTFGVPFPRGALASVENVRIVTAAGQEVPSQIIRTATWNKPDGDVRWMLVDMSAERGAEYLVEYGSKVKRSEGPSRLKVSDEPQQILVTTGPLHAAFSKQHSYLIQHVWLDHDGDGRFSDAEDQMIRQQRRMSMADGTGAVYETSDKPEDYKVEVETNGPRRVVVRASGWYRDKQGNGLCRYVTRVHLYEGKSFVRIFHTFIVAFNTDKTQLRNIAVPFDAADGPVRSAAFAVETGFSPATFDAPAASRLVQDSAEHFAVSDAQGKRLKEGRRAGGWLDIQVPKGGMALALRRMWQDYPKELESTPDGIAAHLWPPHGDRLLDFRAHATLGPERYKEWGHRVYYAGLYDGGLDEYDQAMGLAKTNEMILAFYSRDAKPARAACTALEEAPFLVADPEWMCKSDVFGPLHPYDPKRFPDIERKWEIAFERYEFLRRHFGDYGFFDFGDVHYSIHWDEENRRWVPEPWRRFASRFYGICVMPWTQFARTGSRRYLEWAIDNARHVMDIDMCHITAKVEGYRYPKYAGGRYGGNGGIIHYGADIYSIGCDSHVSQWADYYYLTGYERAWDVLLEEGQFYLDADKENRDGHLRAYAHRMTGGGMRTLIHLWWATWDRRYLDLARRLAGFCYEAAEKEDGVIRHDDVYMNPGLVAYYHATGDERMKELILRCMRWLNEERLTLSDPRGYTFYGPAMAYYFTGDPSYLQRSVFWMQQYQDELNVGDDPLWRGVPKGRWDMCHNCLQLLYGPYLLGALATLDKPVPPADDQATGADEIWLHNTDGRAFNVVVRWFCYMRPFFCGPHVDNWKRYCEKHKPDPRIVVLDPDGKVAARVPMGFGKDPNSRTVSLRVPEGKPGLYRVAQEGAEAMPIKLLLTSLPFPEWAIPIRTGSVSQGPAYYFRVPETMEQLKLRFKVFVLRKTVTPSLLDADGKVIKEETQEFGAVPAAEWTEWTVPAPAEQRGKLWRFQVRPLIGDVQDVLLRIDGVPPVVSTTPESYFIPEQIPDSPHPKPQPAPLGVTTPVQTIAAGNKFVIPRGEKTGDMRYEHLNAKEGTIEFWVRPDWSEDDLSDHDFLRCGGLRMLRRSKIGTYVQLDKAILQSGFVLRPGVWHHVAVAWKLEEAKLESKLRLVIDGVPFGAINYGTIEGATDWTGPAIEIGTNTELAVTGLRISDVSRLEDLQKGTLSPPPDAHTLYNDAELKP